MLVYQDKLSGSSSRPPLNLLAFVLRESGGGTARSDLLRRREIAQVFIGVALIG